MIHRVIWTFECNKCRLMYLRTVWAHLSSSIASFHLLQRTTSTHPPAKIHKKGQKMFLQFYHGNEVSPFLFVPPQVSLVVTNSRLTNVSASQQYVVKFGVEQKKLWGFFVSFPKNAFKFLISPLLIRMSFHLYFISQASPPLCYLELYYSRFEKKQVGNFDIISHLCCMLVSYNIVIHYGVDVKACKLYHII